MDEHNEPIDAIEVADFARFAAWGCLGKKPATSARLVNGGASWEIEIEGHGSLRIDDTDPSCEEIVEEVEHHVLASIGCREIGGAA